MPTVDLKQRVTLPNCAFLMVLPKNLLCRGCTRRQCNKLEMVMDTMTMGEFFALECFQMLFLQVK